MNKVIITIITISVFLLTLNTFPQEFTFGPKINLGAGRINSKNLNESFEFRKADNFDIKKWDVNSKFGIAFGFGGFAEYIFNDKISVKGELSMNFLNHKYYIDYSEVDLDVQGDGDKITIDSEAKIKISYFSFPILAKYKFIDGKGIYGVGGLNFNFISSAKIESEELRTKETYELGVLVDTDIDPEAVTSEINNFNSPRLNFIIGGGTEFEIKDYNFNVEVRYNLPLTKSEMYTNDGVYDNNTFKNNEVFGFWGKIDADNDAPQYRLNDYKMGFIEISFSYALFKK